MRGSKANLAGGAATLPPKPLLRGWFHAVGAVASAAFTAALLIASSRDVPRMVSMLVFGLSMVQMYTVSAVYHIGRWTGRPHRILRSLDHSNIFVLIAGTYTPLCFNVLDGWLRMVMLVGVWTLAAAGMALAVFKLDVPRWVGSSLYIAMGWLSLLVLPALVEAISWQSVALMALGGVLYTAGGIVYALKRPNPFPRVLGFHEVFHLFVIAGSVAFAVVIWVWALPYPRS